MSSSLIDLNPLELTPSLAQRLILTPLQRLFDAIWHFLGFIVGTVLVGGILVNVVISLATTGSPGITNPVTWPISRPILAYPVYALAALGSATCIALGSYLVHRRSHGSGPNPIDDVIIEEFGLSLVQSAVPTPSMIPFYRPAVYVPRRVKGTGADADA